MAIPRAGNPETRETSRFQWMRFKWWSHHCALKGVGVVNATVCNIRLQLYFSFTEESGFYLIFVCIASCFSHFSVRFVLPRRIPQVTYQGLMLSLRLVEKWKIPVEKSGGFGEIVWNLLGKSSGEDKNYEPGSKIQKSTFLEFSAHGPGSGL